MRILQIFTNSKRGQSNLQVTTVLLLVMSIVFGGLYVQEVQNVGDGSEVSTITNTVTDTITETVTTTVNNSVIQEPDPLKIGFIYVGPVSTLGWTATHELARQTIDTKYDWLETNYVESVVEGDAMGSIDFLVSWGADVIFTTSFGFMDETIEAGLKYPDVIFFHVSGFKRASNVGTVFADLYQLYYLNGLMAGALTQTDRLGFVASFPIPEIMRQVNAFHLGAREVNPNIKTEVEYIFSWFDPVDADASTKSLSSKGADVFSFNEDTDAVVLAADGEGALSFSHLMPMQSSAPNSVVSGHLLNWEVLYEEIAVKVRTGVYTNQNLANVDIFGLLHEGAVELGSDFGVAINPVFVEDLKAINVNDPSLGLISVYDLVMARLAQMSDTNIGFDPFAGPLYSQDGTLKLEANERMSIFELLTINWFVGVIGGCVAASDVSCVIGSSSG